jgi:hypothetical protein
MTRSDDRYTDPDDYRVQEQADQKLDSQRKRYIKDAMGNKVRAYGIAQHEADEEYQRGFDQGWEAGVRFERTSAAFNAPDLTEDLDDEYNDGYYDGYVDAVKQIRAEWYSLRDMQTILDEKLPARYNKANDPQDHARPTRRPNPA